MVCLIMAAVLSGSLLFYNNLQKRALDRAGSRQTVLVAVAATDLSWGTVLKKDLVRTVPFLKSSAVQDFILNPASVENRVLIGNIKAGEPITESRLAPSGVEKGGVAAFIRDDRRAMAVKVDKVIGVSGFVHPGSRVDVLVSVSRYGGGSEPLTKTVLEDIPVLATGTEIENKNDKQEKAENVDVITLEVSPEQAEILALASTEGKIQLALRNYTDTKSVQTRGMGMSALLAGSVKTPAVVFKRVSLPRKNMPAGPPPLMMEIIRGNVVQKVQLARRGEPK
jgi:pilus assembly protein CpaB